MMTGRKFSAADAEPLQGAHAGSRPAWPLSPGDPLDTRPAWLRSVASRMNGIPWRRGMRGLPRRRPSFPHFARPHGPAVRPASFFQDGTVFVLSTGGTTVDRHDG